MAGFLGFGNYAKPGKGVKKDGPKKKRFFLFFEIYFRKFWKLVQLNLLYVLFCIPIITIGPATAAMTKIIHSFTMEKPVFLFSDFWDAFKANFKQGLVVGILDLVLSFCITQAWIFYYAKTLESGLYWVLLGIVIIFTLLFAFANYYVYLIISTVDLKLLPILRNSFLLSFLGVRTNFITLFFAGGLTVLVFLFCPIFVSLLLALFIFFSTYTMITAFNSFQYIHKYMIHPYYFQNGLPDPYEPQEELDEADRVFEDAT